jgi:hypothetical protein
MDKIDELLNENMTDISFRMWNALKEKIPDIRHRPSSSSGKYHRRNGSVSSIYDHTYEMLFSCIKLLSIFNVTPKTKKSDILLFSIILHDAFKYGISNPFGAQYTNNTHDRLAANIINDNKSVFMRVFTEEEVNLLEQCLRFHSGRWSSDAGRDFTFTGMPSEVFFIHLLDMLSTHNLLSIGEQSNGVSKHEVSA